MGRITIVATVLLALAVPVAAEPPDVVYVATRGDEGRTEVGVIAGFAEAGRTVVVDEERKLSRLAAAFGPGGRWALLADSKQIAGKTLKKHRAHTLAIAFGDLEHGATAITEGDRACVADKCFEQRPRFSADGKLFYTDAELTGSTQVDRYKVGKGKPKRLVNLKKRLGAIDFPQLSADGKVVSFLRGERELYVEKLPVRKKARPVFSGKGILQMVRSGDRLFFLRHDDASDRFTLEAVDATIKGQTTSDVLFTFAGNEYPGQGALHDPVHDVVYVIDTPRRTTAGVASPDDVYGTLVAIDLADHGTRELATDIGQLLDVSADGASLLVKGQELSRSSFQAKSIDDNPERLGLLDTATGNITWLAIPGAPWIVGAAFRR